MIDMRRSCKCSCTHGIFNDGIDFFSIILQISECSRNGLINDFEITAAAQLFEFHQCKIRFNTCCITIHHQANRTCWCNDSRLGIAISIFFSQLNRFEESVAKEEATAKAFDQLASAGKDENLEAQFAQLGSHSVDSELEALKKERQKPYLPKELPAASA